MTREIEIIMGDTTAIAKLLEKEAPTTYDLM